MAAIKSHHIAGTTLVRYQLPAGSLTDFGYSETGATVAFKQYEKLIHGDQNGGLDGPEVDVISHGQTALITIDMIDYIQAGYEAVIAHRGGTIGVPEVAGTLIYAGAKYTRLLLNNANDPFNFPFARWLDTEEFKLSTNETIHRFRFQAITNVAGGVLWNRTTS